MKTKTYTAPAYWASALVNGDSSGLDDHESTSIDAWLDYNDNPNIVSCSDAAYIGGFDGLMCSMLDYQALIKG